MSAADDRFDSLIRHYWDQSTAVYSFDGAVDWRLAKAQCKQESGFDPQAKNAGTGASGLFQLMPIVYGSHDPFDPDQNIRLGIDHLGSCWAVFKREQGLERWKFALGAYNSGEKHILDVQALLKSRNRPTDQWLEIAAVLHELTGPANAHQTTEYVSVITAQYLAWVQGGDYVA